MVYVDLLLLQVFTPPVYLIILWRHIIILYVIIIIVIVTNCVRLFMSLSHNVPVVYYIIMVDVGSLYISKLTVSLSTPHPADTSVHNARVDIFGSRWNIYIRAVIINYNRSTTYTHL